MQDNITFTMVKPEAVAAGLTGKILDKIITSGFQISALKLVQMTKEQAQTFYQVHSERPFFGDLVNYITSGPVVAAILKKENAVQDFRKLIGATDPAEAEEGTIRKLFATSKEKNAVHGSDSMENAAIEADFLFGADERY